MYFVGKIGMAQETFFLENVFKNLKFFEDFSCFSPFLRCFWVFFDFLAWLGPSEVKINVFSALYCPKEQSAVRFAVYPKRR